MTATKKSPKLVVKDMKGNVLQLATREERGMVGCPGSAHENGFVDHCMVCLGGEYGKVMSYSIPTVEQVLEGQAVPVNWVSRKHAEERFMEALREKQIVIVTVSEFKKGRVSSSYCCYVKAGDSA